MNRLTNRVGLLAGLVLAATLLPAWATGQDKAPTTKQDAPRAPKAGASSLPRIASFGTLRCHSANLAKAAGIKDHKLVGLQSLGASETLQH
jgi:hypothetical protein